MYRNRTWMDLSLIFLKVFKVIKWKNGRFGNNWCLKNWKAIWIKKNLFKLYLITLQKNKHRMSHVLNIKLQNFYKNVYDFDCLVTKSHPILAIPWTVACHASLSMGLSRHYWSGCHFLSRGLLDPGIKPGSPVVLQADW